MYIGLKEALKCFMKMKGVAMLEMLVNNICLVLSLMHLNAGGKCHSACWT